MLAKRLILYIFALTLYINAEGQTGSITPPACSTVPLIVNTFAKYNGGISLQYWTRLRVKFDSPSETGYILQIGADIGYTNFISENLDEIDIETLEIEAANVVDLSGGGIPTLPKKITLVAGGYAELFNENINTNVDFELTITYRLGENAAHRLIGVKPGNYNIVLRVNLISKP